MSEQINILFGRLISLQKKLNSLDKKARLCDIGDCPVNEKNVLYANILQEMHKVLNEFVSQAKIFRTNLDRDIKPSRREDLLKQAIKSEKVQEYLQKNKELEDSIVLLEKKVEGLEKELSLEQQKIEEFTTVDEDREEKKKLKREKYALELENTRLQRLLSQFNSRLLSVQSEVEKKKELSSNLALEIKELQEARVLNDKEIGRQTALLEKMSFDNRKEATKRLREVEKYRLQKDVEVKKLLKKQPKIVTQEKTVSGGKKSIFSLFK